MQNSAEVNELTKNANRALRIHSKLTYSSAPKPLVTINSAKPENADIQTKLDYGWIFSELTNVVANVSKYSELIKSFASYVWQKLTITEVRALSRDEYHRYKSMLSLLS